MFRKAVIAGAIVASLLGAGSSAWAGPDGVSTNRGSAPTTIVDAIQPADADYIILYCGHGVVGAVEVSSNGTLLGHMVLGTTTSRDCQGEYHAI